MRLSKTSINQHASALRMMFSYFTERGVLKYSPAREVKTEKIRRNVGKTPIYEMDDVERLLASFDVSNVVDLRVREYVQQGRRAFIRTHGKGVEVDIPVYHQQAECLDAYLAAAGTRARRTPSSSGAPRARPSPMDP